MAPQLVCPYPYREHPQADEIEARHELWAADLGLGHYEDQRIGRLAAAAYPDGVVPVVELAAATILWIFVTDDWFDDPPGGDRSRHPLGVLRLIRITRDPSLEPDPGQPTQVVLRDITTRLRVIATPTQYHRYADAVAEWLTGLLCTHATEPGLPLTVEDYRLLRSITSGLPIPFALIDLAADKAIPELGPLAGLTTLASDIIALTNDVYSAPKERDERHPVNLPRILSARHNVPPEQGVALTIDYVNELIVEYDRRAIRIASNALVRPASWLTYLHGLSTWIAAHDHWARHITARYPGVCR